MIDFKKWFSRYDEAGFINTRYEKLERGLMWTTLIVLSLTMISLIIWVIKESGSHAF